MSVTCCFWFLANFLRTSPETGSGNTGAKIHQVSSKTGVMTPNCQSHERICLFYYRSLSFASIAFRNCPWRSSVAGCRLKCSFVFCPETLCGFLNGFAQAFVGALHCWCFCLLLFFGSHLLSFVVLVKDPFRTTYLSDFISLSLCYP